jgi:hypothetical protein
VREGCPLETLSEATRQDFAAVVVVGVALVTAGAILALGRTGPIQGSASLTQKLVHFVSDPAFIGSLFARADTQSERNVFEDCHVPKECIVLEYETYLPLTRILMGNVLSSKQHCALGCRIRIFQTGDNSQKSGFA